MGIASPSQGLDVHLQALPVAPGLTPSEPLDPLEGVRNALSCGLDALGHAKNCGLAAPETVASPFLVNFDPLYCRLTMRFPIGELIDGMLRHWLAGAFARLDTPVIGALCGLGISPQACLGGNPVQFPPSVPQRAPLRKPPAAPLAPQPPSGENSHGESGLDALVR